MANNPKHGDEIVVSQKSALGGTKLVAGRQFQEFLDDLGDISLASTADIIQQLAILDGRIDTLFPQINRLDKALDNATQLIAVLDALRDNPVADAATSGGSTVHMSQLFTSSGTWLLPANIVGNPMVTACGGGGGGANSAGNPAGGNGGECCDRLSVNVVANVTVIIGTGGAGATLNFGGSDGGTTSFGALIVLLGGAGGPVNPTSRPVQGGSFGGLNVSGGVGNRGPTGMGISRAGSPGVGTNSDDHNGGGGGLILSTSGVAGGSNLATGGKGFGAGGASDAIGGGATAGAGADGAVLVEWEEAA